MIRLQCQQTILLEMGERGLSKVSCADLRAQKQFKLQSVISKCLQMLLSLVQALLPAVRAFLLL